MEDISKQVQASFSIVLVNYKTLEVTSICLNLIHQAVDVTKVPVWVVDNNSNDNTLILLHELALKYPSKIIVLQEKEKGAPAARNKGLQHLKGNYVQFLDADDLCHDEGVRQD